MCCNFLGIKSSLSLACRMITAQVLLPAPRAFAFVPVPGRDPISTTYKANCSRKILLAQPCPRSKIFHMSTAAGMNKFVATPEPPELGPGPRPGIQSESELNGKLQEFFGAEKLPTQKQELVRALVLLWHDHLESAHVIAQDIDTADGAFVHAIMHRREPDYGNAKYWFRRVGKHPAFAELAKGVCSLLEQSGNRELRQLLVSNGEWDAFAFVDACERAAR